MSAALSGHRGGRTFNPERDAAPLNRQAQDVWDAMIKRGWCTLAQLSMLIGHPEASISARLRDFRKARFGRHEVETRCWNRQWSYRLVPRVSDAQR